MEIKNCRVHEVTPTSNVTESFKKRELIVEDSTNPQYPEYIKFEFHQDKVDKLNELRPGDEITVHFNLRGRPWTDRTGKTSYFNTLVGWKIDIHKTVSSTYGPPAQQQQYQQPPQQQYAPPAQQQYAPPMEFGGNQDDDLPF